MREVPGTSPPVGRDNRQVAGWGGTAPPSLQRAFTPTARNSEGRKPGPAPQNLARAAQPRLLFPPGNAEARGGQRRSAGPRDRRSGGGKSQPYSLVRSVRPGSSTICISLGSPKTLGWSPEPKCPGGTLGVPGSASQPTPVSAQLANSPTFAKLPRAGEQRRSGPHHRGPRGGSGLHWALAASGRSRKSSEKAAARGVWLSAADPEEAGWDARLGRTRGRRCWRRPPPRGGGAVAESGSPACKRRKCRGVGAGPAPRSLLFAEV